MDSSKNFEKEIGNLKSELGALRITLIGIDGKNGMRSQIQDLYKEVSELKQIFNEFIQSAGDMKIKNERQDLIFATKKELKELEEKILSKLEEKDKKTEQRIKESEEERNKEDKRIKNAKWTLYVTLIGIIVREAISLI